MSLGRAAFSMSIRFLALRRLGSSGVAVMKISSEFISVCLIHGAHMLGTSTTTMGALERTTCKMASTALASKVNSRSTLPGPFSRLSLSPSFDMRRSTSVESTRSGWPRASKMPPEPSWLKFREAVPKARSRSVIMVSMLRCCEVDQATLWAMVDEPTPPLAPMKETILPKGAAFGSWNIAAMLSMKLSAETGATRYSLMPALSSSRYSRTSLTWPNTTTLVEAWQTSASWPSSAITCSRVAWVSTTRTFGVGWVW